MFLITAPHEIIQLEVSSSTLASNSSVNVSFIWTQPSSRNGSYKFELQYSAKQIFQVGETRNATSTSQLPGEESIVVLPDGLPYAQYNVTIFAYNIKRGQRYRGQITDVQYLSIPISKLLLTLLVTTTYYPSCLFVVEPTSVNNLTAYASSPASILVQWSPPTYPNGPITNYKVFYKEGNSPQSQPIFSDTFSLKTVNSDRTSLNITDLKPYTNYTIHVQAVISAQELENDLIGAIEEEIVARTNGTTPNQTVMIDNMPLASPTATTFQIMIPRTSDVNTGKVL